MGGPRGSRCCGGAMGHKPTMRTERVPPLARVQGALSRAFETVPAIMRFAGGFGPTLRKAVRVVTREGISGVRWRIDYVREFHKYAGAQGFIDCQSSFAPPVAATRANVLFADWHVALSRAAAGAAQPYTGTITLSAVLHNSERWLPAFLRSLERQSFPVRQINLVFVDNGSSDGTCTVLKAYAQASGHLYASLRIIEQDNVGFGAGHDVAIGSSTDDLVLVTNVDLEFHKEGLAQAVAAAVSDEADVASWELRQCPYEHPKYYDPVTLETSWSAHACTLLRRSAYDAVGGYEKKIFMYGEDVELSYRLRGAGWRLRYVPFATVTHHVDFEDGTLRPHQVSGSIAANILLRHRYGTSGEAAEGERLAGVLARGERDGGGAVGAALGIIARDKAHFATRLRPVKDVPFPFSGLDYDIRRVGHDVPLMPSAGLEERPLVSIITRTHGPKISYLREAMASVINQTYREIEHLIVEDRTDFARELVEQAADVYRRNIRYVKSDGSGRSRAGNCGLAAARGRYVLFLDSDDLLFADHVEHLMQALATDKAAVAAYSLAWEVLTDEDASGAYIEVLHRVSKLHQRGFDRRILKTMNYIPIQAIAFDRWLYEKFGGFQEDLDYLEDWNLWNRYVRAGDFIYVPKLTSLYRTPYGETARANRQEGLSAAYKSVKQRNAAR